MRLHRRYVPSNFSGPLRVLDLCTGTGCIPLLFHHEYYSGDRNSENSLELLGVDISPDALSLARENLILQIAEQAKTLGSESTRLRSLHRVGFIQADVLNPEAGKANAAAEGTPSLTQALKRFGQSFDILISNPPYISPKSFYRTTHRSVRNYEPKLALVPPASSAQGDEAIGDAFYPRLLQVAKQVGARILLLEVADMEQAQRIASLTAADGIWQGIEIWRDDPSGPAEDLEIGSHTVHVRGSGHGRSVFAYREAE